MPLPRVGGSVAHIRLENLIKQFGIDDVVVNDLEPGERGLGMVF
jgi:hypothetical protein